MSSRKTYRWQVFISHNKKQKPWVREVVKQWKKLGLKVFFDEDDIPPGSDITRGVERGLEGSRHVALVLTRESLKSRWVALETAISIYQDPSAQEDRIIPIQLESLDGITVPLAIGRLNRVDLAQPDPIERKASYHRLLKKLGVKKKPLPNPPKRNELTIDSRPRKSFHLSEGGKAIAIGAHWDDILLGCFGTLLKLRLVLNYEVTLCVLCNGYEGSKYYGVEQPADFRERVETILKNICQEYGMKFTSPDGRPSQETKIVDRRFHDNARQLHIEMRRLAHKHEDCNLIFTPPIDDGHEDHSLTGQLVFSYFRKTYQTILEYEIKRYLEGAFVPNVFMNLDDRLAANGKQSIAEVKVSLLSRLIAKRNGIAGSSFLFDADPLKARLIMQALNYGGDKNIKFGEAFRGRITL